MEATIISLTSYPARIESVYQTIISLINQTCKPTKIVLWLAESQFPGKKSSLPDSLVELESSLFEIRWCADIKSYKKLIPALQQFKNFNVVTADDDIIYPRDWFEKLYNSYSSTVSEKIIWCHRAHVVKINSGIVEKYKNWSMKCYDTSPSFRVFCTTGGGVFFPKNCFSENLPNDYMEICPTADDVWFWGMLILNDYKICVVKNPMRGLELNEASQDDALWLSNIETQNDISLSNLFNKYPEILNRLVNSPTPEFKQFGYRNKKIFYGLIPIKYFLWIMPVVNLIFPLGSARRKFLKRIIRG